MVCTACTSPEQIDMAMQNPGSLVPTFEFRIRTIDLPLDAQDISYLDTEIKVFAEEESVTTPSGASRMTTSRNFEQPEFQLPTDFIALGVCALAYVEPYGMGVDGNVFGPPAAVCALPFDLLSPDVLYNEQGAFPAPGNTQFTACTTMCPAQLDFGTSTWKFADWFFKTYRMSVGCQISNGVHEILNERLIDMGNCCADTAKEGFSTAFGSYAEAVRLVNEKLIAMAGQTALLPPATAAGPAITLNNMGLFQPLNAHAELVQNAGDNTAPTGRRIRTTAERLTVQPQAFGGVQAGGAGLKWYKFDVPRVIRAHRNIKISLNRYDEDLPNWIRMIREGSIRTCDPATFCTGTTRTQIVVGDASSYTAYARSTMARIPGGRIQIGIGLKGLILDASLCNDVESLVNNMSAAQCAALGWKGGPCGQYDTASPTVASLTKALSSGAVGCRA